jgi:two-component system NtrC family sensor kinase
MKVLIVEDNPDSRNLLTKQLSAYGHEVTAAVDGVDALEKAQKSPPDILVSDILMPRMDGYKLCYEWKQHERLKDIPFVFYTAIYTSSQDEKFALSLGANLFIRKPLEPEALARILSQALEQAKEGLLPVAKVPPEPSLYLSEYNERLVAKLNEKVAELEKSEAELRYLSSVLGAIRNINQLIVRERDKAKLLKEACRILHKVREYRFVWLGLIEEGHKRVIPVARAGVGGSYLDAFEITWDDSESGKGPTGTAIKTKKPNLIKNIAEDPRSAAWREEVLKRGYRSSAAIPIIHDEKVYGVLNVYSSHPDGFDDTEVELLVEVSSDLGFALKAIERQEARQRAEEALGKERDRAQNYLDIAGVMIIVIDKDKRVSLVNQKGCQILGCDEKEIIGKNWFRNCLPKRIRAEVEAGFEKLIAGGIKHMEYNENPVLTKSGEERIIAWHNTVIRDGAGGVVATLSSGEDITERKKAEEALRESEARYRAVIEGAHDMIQSISLDGGIIFVNKSWLDTLGYTEAELSGLNLFDIIHPDSQAHCREMMAEVAKGKPVQGMEATLLTKDGREILVEGDATPRYIGKKVVASQGIFRDVTERKRAEAALRQSEEKLRVILESIPLGVTVTDLEGKILQVNNATLRVHGYSARQELIGRKAFELITEEGHARAAENLKKTLETGRGGAIEYTLIRKDGTTFPAQLSAALVKDESAKPIGFVAVTEDITARKQAEDALRESETFQSGLLANSPIPISVINADSSVRYVNPALERLTGFSAEELVGQKAPYSYWPKEEEDSIMKRFKKAVRQGDAKVEELFQKKSGEVFWVEITSTPVKKDGKLQYLVANWVDITERKLAEEALRESNKRFTDIAENALQLIWEVDTKGKYTYVSPIVEKILGYKPEEVVGKNIYDLSHPDERAEFKRTLFAAFAERRPFRQFLNRLVHKNGETVWLLSNGVPILDEAGKLLGYRGAVVDVTERERAERALRESQEKYKNLVEATSDIIWETDTAGWFTFINPRVKDILGYEVEEVVGQKRTLDFVPKGEAQKWLKRFKEVNARKEPFFGFEITHLHRNGRPVICEVSGIPLFDSAGKFLGWVGIDKDITERRQMQEQLVIADRLASVGELAAGIAHELNNPLTGVIGFSQLLLDREMPEDIKQDIKVVYSEAQRASQVVKNLLTFARKHAAAKERVKINDIIKKVLELRAYEQNLENIKVDTRFDPDLPEIMVDYFQLQQVFLNIIINAEYFMKEAHHKGELTITTEMVDNKVRASFADDGPGIAKENLGHLFDPFFTTKEVGKGTGLGLSICHGIVAEHGGRIYVESEPGKGATFIVELPIGAAEKKGGAA